MVRVTIQEAARRLGVKEDAIRKRIQRSSLRHEKTEEGRVFVWVDTAQDYTQATTEDVYQDTSRDALLAAKDETITALREQLAQAHERDRENRRIIAALTSRIPALEAPSSSQEPRGSSTVDAEEQDSEPRSTSTPAHSEAQEAQESLSSPLKGRYVAALVVLASMVIVGALLYLAFTVLSP